MYKIHSTVTRQWNVRKLQMVVATCTIYQKSSLHCCTCSFEYHQQWFFKNMVLKTFFLAIFLVQNTEINKNLMSLSLPLLMEETQTFNHKTFNKKLLMIPWWLNCFVFASDMFCNYFFFENIAAKNLHKLKNKTIILPFCSTIH